MLMMGLYYAWSTIALFTGFLGYCMLAAKLGKYSLQAPTYANQLMFFMWIVFCSFVMTNIIVRCMKRGERLRCFEYASMITAFIAGGLMNLLFGAKFGNEIFSEHDEKPNQMISYVLGTHIFSTFGVFVFYRLEAIACDLHRDIKEQTKTETPNDPLKKPLMDDGKV
jgi:hypothetical protein